MIRKQMFKAVQPQLHEGEHVVSVAMGQHGSPAWQAVGAVGALLFRIKYYVVAYTNQRVLICYTGRLGVRKVHSVVAELPVGTRLPVPVGVWSNIDIPVPGGVLTLRVATRFSKDIAAGNARATTPPRVAQR